jgi:hypothetical protein
MAKTVGFDLRNLIFKIRSFLTNAWVIFAGGIVLGIGVPLAGSLFSSGTDLMVGHIGSNTPSFPSAAIPYVLPQTSLIVKSITVVTNCKDTPSGEEIHGSTTLSISTEVEPDPTQQYFIYFDSGTKSKNLSYEVKSYDNGVLNSVDVTIKDQVAPITAAIAGGLLKVLPSIPPPLAAPPPLPPPTGSNCKKLNAEIASDPKSTILTLAETHRWLPQIGLSPSLIIQISLDRLKSRFGLVAPRWSRVNATVQIEQLNSSGGDSPDVRFTADKCQSGELCKPPLADGLVLRNAVRARVSSSVCDEVCAALPGATERSLYSTGRGDGPSLNIVVPQFGSLFLVKVHSGYAQDAGVAVELDRAGMITRLHSISVNSLGENISEILNNAGENNRPK